MFSSRLARRLEMKAYSMDFRKRVLALCDAGHGTHEVAKGFGVSESWVRRLKQRRREDGTAAPRPSGGRCCGHFEAVRLEQLEQWLRQQPDATLAQLRGRVQREMGLCCSVMAVCRAVKKLGWSLKRDASCERTGSPGRSAAAHELLHRAALRRCESACFSRRIQCQDKHDAPLLACASRPALPL